MSSAAPSIPFGGIPRVNLIPRSELDRRERASAARKWIWGVVGAILASLALIAGAMTINWLADQRLLVEQARTNALLTELASLSEVSGAIASERELIDYRAQSAGSDFAWAPVVAELRRALPSGVELVGFALTTGGVPQGEDPAAEVGLVGSLTLSSPNAIDIAQTVRAMRALAGVADADGRLVSTSQQSVGAYTYEISVAFDQSIYSGRFAATEGEQ
jgi:hypothetical protein